MKIAVLGASEPHLPLYLKAKQMGLETHCIAWAKGAYCRNYADHFHDISIVDKEAVAQLCLDEKIDGIVSNALEPAVPTVAYVSERCGMNGISYEAALRAINKKKMRLRVQEFNACPQPGFHLLQRSEAIPATSFPVIIKPTDSSCSSGVTKVTDTENLPGAIERALAASASHEILVEEFIDGREVSVESISYHGKHYVLTITDKETTGAPYFVETAHHQPSNLPEQIQNRLREYVVDILRALEITNGASHAEFKIDASGNIFFIEIGARGGGDFISYELVRLSTGYDYVKGMIEVALNRFTEPQFTDRHCSGVYFLSENTSGVKDFILRNRERDWVVGYKIEDTPLRTLTRSQDRSGHIIYRSDHKITLLE